MAFICTRRVALLLAFATQAALAEPTFVDGSLYVIDTPDTAAVWDLLGVTYGQSGSATVRTTHYNNEYSYDVSTFAQPATSATAHAGELATVSAADAGFTMSRTSYTGPHTLTISNLSLDLGQRTVYADITTEQGSFVHQAWLVPLDSTYAITGSTGSPTLVLGADGYMHATGSLTNLTIAGTWDYPKQIATGALSIIDRGLNITSVSQGAIYSVPYADIAYDLRFAVPEPSTYALTMLGFAAAVAVARRQSSRLSQPVSE